MTRKAKVGIATLPVVGVAGGILLQQRSQGWGEGSHPMTDWGVLTPEVARAQAAAFIADYRSIGLTPDQERTKIRALEAIPAPCCDDNSIATCCCPCNLAKAVWGLSARLIAEEGAGVRQVRESVRGWLHAVNERGWSGDACYVGRCDRPFHVYGCGGMDERMIF
jgi:hypothetical protein